MVSMRIEDRVRSDYFEWMYELMCGNIYGESVTFRKLFTFLHDTEFTYFVPHDENRAADGIDLRYRFCLRHDCEDLEYCLDGPCSVLEMMVALAIRCEERIMSDPNYGDRTSQWFWSMISSLGLSGQTDYNFNERLVQDVLFIFLNREYAPNGKGGLFTIRRWDRDARDVEIWHQLMAYLNTLR